MTHTDVHTGAPRRKAHATRAFVTQLRAEEPKAKADEICRRAIAAFREHVDEEGQDIFLDALKDWLLDNVTDKPPRRMRTAEERAQSKAATATLVEQIATNLDARIEAAVQTRFLEEKMINGRKLADCTGAMCRRFGGFYAEIAKRLRPSERVGGHLTEAEIAAIAKTWRIEDC